MTRNVILLLAHVLFSATESLELMLHRSTPAVNTLIYLNIRQKCTSNKFEDEIQYV